MLQDNLFKIVSRDDSENKPVFLIDLDPGHHIFDGHFPDMPVLPGVCSMQIIHELVQISVGSQLQLQKADFLKFLAVITPQNNARLNIEINYQSIENGITTVNASIFSGETVFLKFKGSFSKA